MLKAVGSPQLSGKKRSTIRQKMSKEKGRSGHHGIIQADVKDNCKDKTKVRNQTQKTPFI